MKKLPGVVRADDWPAIGKQAPRHDGWQSTWMGVGTGRDKLRTLQFGADRLSYEQLAELWEGDDMAARIVEIWPEEMLRKGWVFVTPDDKIGMEEVSAHLEKIGLHSELWQAIAKMRAFGGSGILLGANDGQTDLSLPLVPERVTSLDWLTCFDCREIRPSHYYGDPMAPKFGKPSHYLLAPAHVGQELTDKKKTARSWAESTPIHESRFLIFDGIRVSNRYYSRGNNGWGQSVLNRVWAVLQGFNMSWTATWHLVTEASLAIFKTKGLADMLKKDSGKTIQQRLTTLDFGKSVARGIAIDADLESYERLTIPMTGLAEVLDRGGLRLSAAAGIPLTILLGASPGGLGSNGAGEQRSFYDRVASMQPLVLTPAIKRVVGLLTKLYQISPGYKITYPSLWTPTELEAAQARNVQMLTDVGYVNANVLFSDEVAESRFAGAEYSFETIVDFEERARLEHTPLPELPAKALESLETGDADVPILPPSLPPPPRLGKKPPV